MKYEDYLYIACQQEKNNDLVTALKTLKNAEKFTIDQQELEHLKNWQQRLTKIEEKKVNKRKIKIGRWIRFKYDNNSREGIVVEKKNENLTIYCPFDKTYLDVGLDRVIAIGDFNEGEMVEL